MGTRAPYATSGKTGRPPFARATMLRFDCLQQWFGLSDPAVEEGLHDVALDLEFIPLDAVMPHATGIAKNLQIQNLILNLQELRPR